MIVDDEPPARQTLRLLLEREKDFAIVAECGHGQEAIAAVLRERPDVLFLDVRMPGMDGFDVLRRIPAGAVPAIVFVTAYDRYAPQAFEQHAIEYLLKPFTDERFADVVDHVRRGCASGPTPRAWRPRSSGRAGAPAAAVSTRRGRNAANSSSATARGRT